MCHITINITIIKSERKSSVSARAYIAGLGIAVLMVGLVLRCIAAFLCVFKTGQLNVRVRMRMCFCECMSVCVQYVRVFVCVDIRDVTLWHIRLKLACSIWLKLQASLFNMKFHTF